MRLKHLYMGLSEIKALPDFDGFNPHFPHSISMIWDNKPAVWISSKTLAEQSDAAED